MKSIVTHCKFDELVDPKELIDNPINHNSHSKDQIARLAKLYTYHGIRHPIIVSQRSGCIVAGHGRKQAAIKAKIGQFPVVYQAFDSDDAEYAFVQSDNAIAAWAELDLSSINADLADLGPDFDVDMLGIKDFVIEPADKADKNDEEEKEECPMCGKKVTENRQPNSLVEVDNGNRPPEEVPIQTRTNGERGGKAKRSVRSKASKKAKRQ